MKFFFPGLFEKKQKNHQDKQPATAVHEPLHGTTEGSEFLDDAIRMKEQPFKYSQTEQSIAPGWVNDVWSY